MKFWPYLLSIMLLIAPIDATPLFPDLSPHKKVRSALKALAAKGLVEGYPDGTFKSDRSISRWEAALLVARLLEKTGADSTFAAKAERGEVERLAVLLEDELVSIGIRFEQTEQQLNVVEERVTKLETIGFYGFLDSRVTFPSFTNEGLDAMRSLNPGIAFDNLNYNSIVGAAAGAGGDINRSPFTGSPPPGGILPPGQGAVVPILNPLTSGISRVRKWNDGRPLTSGTGFTSRAVLGLTINVNEDIEAGIELSAYSSQGDAIVGTYYGVHQPYLSNPSTVRSINTSGLGPNTRMTLDRFWLEHNGSGTKLILGSYQEHEFNDSIYNGLWNPAEFGPEFLENFGFLLSGRSSLDQDESSHFDWQIMGTILPDGSPGSFTPGSPGSGDNYFSHVLGLKLGYEFDDGSGRVRFNFLRAADEAADGALLTTGLLQVPNLRAQMQWVNPDGYFIEQLRGMPDQTAGLGSAGDIRPVPTSPIFAADGSLADQVRMGLLPQGVPNVGGIGPQQQSSWGLDFQYEFDHKWSPKAFGEYAHSSYRPNKNSNYTAEGSAWRLGGSMRVLKDAVDLGAEYVSVDPRFSPFIIQMPTVARVSFVPGPHYHQNLFALHDVEQLPHNREGVRVHLDWKFRPTGKLSVEYEAFQQKTSSVQDVRFSANSLGTSTPNTPVLGYSPGWIEPIFGPYHQASFGPSGGNALAVPRENEKGRAKRLLIKGGYKWVFDQENSNRGIKISGGYRLLSLDRGSNMQTIGKAAGFPGAGTQAENQNLVDLDLSGWNVKLDYDVTDDFLLFGGLTQVNVKGHLDPFNTTGLYAESVGTARFTNLYFTQTMPELGFEWEVKDGVTWSALARKIQLDDRVPTHLFVNPSVGGLNIQNGPQTTHPFSWQGVQVTSQIRIQF